MRRQAPGRSQRPPIRTATYTYYSTALRRKGPRGSVLVPVALLGWVVVLATTIVFIIIIKGPDTHSSLWNETRGDYSRTGILFVASQEGPPLPPLTPTARPSPAPAPVTPSQPGTVPVSPSPSPSPTPTSPPPPAEVSFSRGVMPVLKANCILCHGGAGVSFKNVNLASYQGVADTQAHGPLFVPGKPEESLLVNVLRGKGVQMPPSGPLPEEDIVTIEQWVKQGAKNN